jgi:hypothetical protein
VKRPESTTDGYCESILKALGAESVESLDVSTEEGASIVHDLNEPIPVELKARFHTVFDGGTIEHVFNFPVAIRNCMEMVAIGGHYIGVTVANNCCGHGFYQFSPGLFFAVFCENNGFVLENAILCATDPAASWVRLAEPWSEARCSFQQKAPTYLLIHARRTHASAIFGRYPQQSLDQMHWEAIPPKAPPLGKIEREWVVPRN